MNRTPAQQFIKHKQTARDKVRPEATLKTNITKTNKTMRKDILTPPVKVNDAFKDRKQEIFNKKEFSNMNFATSTPRFGSLNITDTL